MQSHPGLITINGNEKRVVSEGGVLHGFIYLNIGPGGPLSQVESVHKVPVGWWQNRADRSRVTTGGCTYGKVDT